MGNKITFHSRVLLTQELALRFRTADLQKDVLPMIKEWRSRGAGLTLGLEEFQNIFGKLTDPKSQFELFDTERNGKVDAHEVILAAVMLSSADVQRKVEAAFGIFDASGRSGLDDGNLNFEEVVIILEACSRGLLKIAEFGFQVREDELQFHCRSLFEMHRMHPTATLSLRQFKEWAMADPAPHSFIYLFHLSHSLADLNEQAKEARDDQDDAFRAAAQGHTHATAEALKQSDAFRGAIEAISDEEVEYLVDLMLEGDAVTTRKSEDSVKMAVGKERFRKVLRPWNIFNQLDLDGNGTLDEKDIEALLWALSGKRPSVEDVNSFSKLAGAYTDGGIDRATWVEAVVSQQDGRLPHFHPKQTYANVRRTRLSVTSIAPMPDRDRRASRMSVAMSPSLSDDDCRQLVPAR